MRTAGVLLAACACAAWAQEHELVRRLPTAVRVSAESPFTEGCDGTQTGSHFRNAASEPWLAVDPRNPLRLAGIWQQDRWSNGASTGLVAALSLDGGETWRQSLPPFSACAGAEARYVRVSDPWITIAPDGAVHAIALAVTASQDAQTIFVSRSRDGIEWSAPVKLIEDQDPNVFDDKEAITADPFDSRYVYAVWDRLSNIKSNTNYRGPAYFSRTTDGGLTWEPARAIFDPGANAQTIGNQIVVLPDGTLLDAFALIQNASAPLVRDSRIALAVIRSTDRGETWSAPVAVASMQVVGVSDVKTNAPVRSGANLPSLSVDAITGAVYAVWADGRFSGGRRAGIAFSESLDGGATWSAPTQVNQAPNVQAFTPAVAARGGEIAVTYYDFRKDTDDANVLLASYWRILSLDGGRSWTEAPLSEPFDLTAAAKTDGGYFLGDYAGLAAANGRFVSLFVASAQGAIPASVFAASRPTGGDTLHNGRTEVNRYLLRKEIEPQTKRRQVVRNNP